MEIRNADNTDCPAIAELAQLAGGGMPVYFWADSQQVGESLEATGFKPKKSNNSEGIH